MSSTLHFFAGKHWQIRSIQNAQTKEWFAFPFIINNGGTAWYNPILSDFTLMRMGLIPDKVRYLDEPGRKFVLLQSPFGAIPEPTFANWDSVWQKNISPGDVRFNLLGEELASCVVICDQLAHTIVKNGRQHDAIFIDERVNEIAERFVDYGATPDHIKAEVMSMVHMAGSAWLSLWSELSRI